jgi:protein ImuA
MGMSMPIPHQHQPRQMQAFIGPLALARGRVHEFCGPSRRALAAMLLGRTEGPVIWALPAWQAERIYPCGLESFADPRRVIWALCRQPLDLLWSVEETLRSGAVPLMVVECLSPPGLTPIRRLHLAAEAGAELAGHRGGVAPMAVVLTPEGGGAAGVETRWHMAPRAGMGSTTPWADDGPPQRHWHLQRLRARLDPVADWTVTRTGREISLGGTDTQTFG